MCNSFLCEKQHNLDPYPFTPGLTAPGPKRYFASLLDTITIQSCLPLLLQFSTVSPNRISGPSVLQLLIRLREGISWGPTFSYRCSFLLFGLLHFPTRNIFVLLFAFVPLQFSSALKPHRLFYLVLHYALHLWSPSSLSRKEAGRDQETDANPGSLELDIVKKTLKGKLSKVNYAHNVGSFGNKMKVRGLPLLYLLLLGLLSCHGHALNPDGKALLAFKTNLKNSDEVLPHWREGDLSPCNWRGITCDSQTGRVVSLNLASYRLWGNIAPDLGRLDQLQRLALHRNSLYGPIPPILGDLSHLKALLLQDNYLSGQIPAELGRLLELKILDISSNALSGTIPDSLGNLQNLTSFNVSTNFLIGEIPENGTLRNFGGKSFVGNMGLCGQQVGEICKSQLEEPSTTPESSSSPLEGVPGPPLDLRKKSSKSSTEFLISALGTVGLSLLIALMCFWGCFLYHKFGKKHKAYEGNGDDGAMVVIFHSDIPYTSKEIIRRIELLDESHVIGHGGFGTVYKLVMEDSSAFAVKRIDKNSLSFDRLFERELEVLGSIKHRNLVNLRGYCNSPSAKLLIYDHLQNGSLEEVLHDRDPDESSLSWGARLKIAVGAARGLAYLHHDCSPRIIHRDVKSSNILIGENLEPHVSDFGLAKLLEDNISHVTTVIAGTFGYLAPEYLQSGRATEKTDVYSYGIVLLELISGKRPSDASFVQKGLNIVGWAISLKKEKNLKEILDPRCEGAFMDSLEALLQIALLCLSPMPDGRPTMHEVVKMLEAEIMSPCPSDFYDSNSD